MQHADRLAAKKARLIFLLGFMGSGKSYWGRVWTQKSVYSLTDLDKLIESAENASVANIFATHGEAYFRKVEAETLRAFKGKENLVIACGGGTPCFFDNMDWMLAHGTTVWLRASPERILENISKQPGTRPLLQRMNQDELLPFVQEKLKEREPYYGRAHLTLDVDVIKDDSLDTIILNK